MSVNIYIKDTDKNTTLSSRVNNVDYGTPDFGDFINGRSRNVILQRE